MNDQLSAEGWVEPGLKTPPTQGFAALKADPLAKAMGVSRGSFYWHFADVGAFHAEILKAWHEIAAERIIADVDAAAAKDDALQLLLRRVFGERLALENAVRRWAVVDATAGAAVEAIDKRRQDYIESLFRSRALSPEVARARTQILYWSYLGFALADRPLPLAQQRAV